MKTTRVQALEALATARRMHGGSREFIIVEAYLNQEPERPDAEVWGEIEKLLGALDMRGDTDDHFLFSCDGKQFGCAKIPHSKWIQNGDAQPLPAIRDDLRTIVKPSMDAMVEIVTWLQADRVAGNLESGVRLDKLEAYFEAEQAKQKDASG